MSKIIKYDEKTYRHIKIGDKIYAGKDGHKNRESDYIINMFDKTYFSNKKVLDLACASGAILFHIMDKIKTGTGVDVDNLKLNIGKQLVEKHNIQNIDLHELKLEEFINNSTETYDCIFLLNILHHIQDPYGVLNLIAEICDDKICIEAPEEGFYRPYKRDIGKEVLFDKIDVADIIDYLNERNYELVKKEESRNQENFIGPKRYVCIFQKKKIEFADISDIKKLNNGIVIGPGASGKTRLLHKIYDTEIEYKGNDIIKNNVFGPNGKSLKFGKNVQSFTDSHPIVYLAPNHGSDDYTPNIDKWISEIKNAMYPNVIICYIRPYTHRTRLWNRIENKKGTPENQHSANYPFSYQNLFYKLDLENINYIIINSMYFHLGTGEQ